MPKSKSLELTKQPEFLGFKKDRSREYKCAFCNDTVTVDSSVFYGECPSCKAIIIDYKPQPHQVAFHKSDAKYRLNLGGYGSGKTTMNCAEVARHVYTTPNGQTLITAPKLQLVRDAVLVELMKFFPDRVFKSIRMSPNIEYEFQNGHKIVVYASNDEGNLRSLNLSMFYMEEASEIKLDIFVQLRTRLRRASSLVFDEVTGFPIKDNTKGIIASNPEQGWLVDDFLLLSDTIYASKSVDTTSYQALKRAGEIDYHSFLSSSRDNNYLPATFVNDIAVGRTQSWVAKYIDCSMEAREGAVYPEYHTVLVDDFPIPNDWQRIYGFDFGIRDETAMLAGAIRPTDGTIFIYKEYYVANEPVSYHARMINETMMKTNGWRHNLYIGIQADPAIRQRSQQTGDTYQMYFHKRSGLWLEPANNDIFSGISKVKDYMFLGKVKIFKSLENLTAEAQSYVFKEDVEGKVKPIDKNNHLLDCLKYLISPLPDRPEDFATEIINADLGLDWNGYEDEEDSVEIINGKVIEKEHSGGVIVGRNLYGK